MHAIHSAYFCVHLIKFIEYSYRVTIGWNQIEGDTIQNPIILSDRIRIGKSFRILHRIRGSSDLIYPIDKHSYFFFVSKPLS